MDGDKEIYRGPFSPAQKLLNNKKHCPFCAAYKFLKKKLTFL